MARHLSTTLFSLGPMRGPDARDARLHAIARSRLLLFERGLVHSAQLFALGSHGRLTRTGFRVQSITTIVGARQRAHRHHAERQRNSSGPQSPLHLIMHRHSSPWLRSVAARWMRSFAWVDPFSSPEP